MKTIILIATAAFAVAQENPAPPPVPEVIQISEVDSLKMELYTERWSTAGKTRQDHINDVCGKAKIKLDECSLRPVGNGVWVALRAKPQPEAAPTSNGPKPEQKKVEAAKK